MSLEKDSELKVKAKKLRRVLQEMSGKAVIVEGKKDRLALELLGLRARIIECNQSPDKIASKLEGEEKAFVLTDFDRRGEEKAKALAGALASYSVEADLNARRTLRHVLGIMFFEDAFSRFQEFMQKCMEKNVQIGDMNG